MKILAFDTSQLQACALVLTHDGKLTQVLAEKIGDIQASHSESFLRLIDDLLFSAQLELKDFDAFAVGVGPGSFTGLRIGCATAKAFAQIYQKKIYAFSSLQALSYSVQNQNLQGVLPISLVNAYQGQVFAGWLKPIDSAAFEFIQEVLSVDQFLKNLKPDELQFFCGNGSLQNKTLIEESSLGYKVLMDSEWITAQGVCRLLQDILSNEKFRLASEKDYLSLQANYMRPSQAEIKLAVANP